MTASALPLRPRRLPGIAFETRAPAPEEVLPRMDVAALVGFAASGPVGVPVPVEDAAQFAAVFGADAPLAWDAGVGRVAMAQLAPAVRAFFANGGRRCWVVRLARAAATATLPVPGVAVAGERGHLAPLALVARSPGSWADGVALAASLTSRRLGAVAWYPDALVLDLVAPGDAAPVPGDLLRLAWREGPDAGVVLHLGVTAVEARDGGTEREPRQRRRLRVTGRHAAWFDSARDPARSVGRARLAGDRCAAARLVDDAASPPDASTSADGAPLTLDLRTPAAPDVGAVTVVRFGADELVLAVREVVSIGESGAGRRPTVRIRGTGLWRRDVPEDSPHAAAPPASPLASPPDGPLPTVERLALGLWARAGGQAAWRVGELGLAPGHQRHVEALPDDEAAYGTPDWADAPRWRDVLAPRFPAAGAPPRDAAGELAPRLCIPLGVGTLPGGYLPALVPAGGALERDGLVPFDAALFADEALADDRATTLLADAEYVRFLAPAPRPRLAGLHAVLPVEEVTLIAVPDAAQPGWNAPLVVEQGEPLPPEPSEVEERDFAACLASPPTLCATARDATLAVELAWEPGDDAAPSAFVVEESVDRAWRGAVVVFEGTGRAVTLAPRRPGDYYYRVRGVGAGATPWSEGAAVRIAAGDGWRLRRPHEYRDDVLVAVHRLLLRLCVARRDVMAVLALPEHYREDAAAAHVRRLASPRAAPLPLSDAPRAPLVAALGGGEGDALGFAALYHGWIHLRDEDAALRAIAPDGPACGVIARRAIERGAWVAPANEPLRGAIALEGAAALERWQELQQLQVNVVRRLPVGFGVLSADTLAADDDVRPIGVRRLLILLRRLALRLGATYVFEPNDDTFRRGVQRGFEALLGDMFEHGAFAGRTEDEAFRVVTGEALNTPRTVERGQFVVELRVAPSRPMAFLTIRLVQTGDRIAVTGS